MNHLQIFPPRSSIELCCARLLAVSGVGIKQAFINAGVMYLSKKIISVDILRGKSAAAPLAMFMASKKIPILMKIMPSGGAHPPHQSMSCFRSSTTAGAGMPIVPVVVGVGAIVVPVVVIPIVVVVVVGGGGVVGFWVPVVPLSCAVTNAPSALDPDPAAPSLVVAPSYISGRWNNLQLLEEPTNINSSFPCPCFANVTNHNALAHVAPKLIQANKTILLLNEIKNGQRRHRGVESNKV